MGSISSDTPVTPNQVPNDDEAIVFAMQLAGAVQLHMVLKAALELDLLEIIAKAGPGARLSPREIASQLPTENPDAATVLDRILCLLAANSIVTCTLSELPDGRTERLYGIAPVSKFLIKNEDGVSIGPLCLLSRDKVFIESCYHLKDAVLEGVVPFNKAHGMTAFEYCCADPRFSERFNKAMSDVSTITMKEVLEKYKGFKGLKSVVDVGGGTGAVLNMIISKYPSIKGINFDLPHVIENAPSYPGIEHVGGDMFASVPRGDAIFVKWICHNWGDEHCLKLLKNCYNALPKDGKVIVADIVSPELPDTSLAAKIAFQFDTTMMAYHVGGKERTEKDFRALAKAAGFKGFRIACVAFYHIMEFLKN